MTLETFIAELETVEKLVDVVVLIVKGVAAFFDSAEHVVYSGVGFYYILHLRKRHGVSIREFLFFWREKEVLDNYQSKATKYD